MGDGNMTLVMLLLAAAAGNPLGEAVVWYVKQGA